MEKKKAAPGNRQAASESVGKKSRELVGRQEIEESLEHWLPFGLRTFGTTCRTPPLTPMVCALPPPPQPLASRRRLSIKTKMKRRQRQAPIVAPVQPRHLVHSSESKPKSSYLLLSSVPLAQNHVLSLSDACHSSIAPRNQIENFALFESLVNLEP